MSKTRANFKYIFRRCNKDKQHHVADSLAKTYLCKDSNKFWQAIKKVKNNDKPVGSSTINGVSGNKNIAEAWQCHFKQLLNSGNSSCNTENVQSLKNITLLQESLITPDQVQEAVSALKCGKAHIVCNIPTELLRIPLQDMMVYVLNILNILIK